MQDFYFTYGAGGFDFVGGWTTVFAPDIHAAVAAFRVFHPDKTTGIINCSSIYTALEFDGTEMKRSGNFGQFCHEAITLNRETFPVKNQF